MVSNLWTFASAVLILYTAQITSEVIQCAVRENCVCQEQGQCDIYCPLKDGCDGAKVTVGCFPNYPCNVHCSGESSCKALHINANESTTVQMICSAKDACKGSSTSLTCGAGECSLSCLHSQSCQDMVVDTNMAHSFQCLGVCPLSAVLQQYTQRPTLSPTLRPTALPTVVSPSPTFIPSTYPSLAPTSTPTQTSSPTLSPTKSPTSIAPTDGPSPSPTSSASPTDVPTATPSLSPTATTTTTMTSTSTSTSIVTLLPTALPSRQPSMIPSFSPSMLPTLAPTVTESTLQPISIATNEPTVSPTRVPESDQPTRPPTALPTTGAPSATSEAETTSISVPQSRCKPHCIEDTDPTGEEDKITIDVQYWFSANVRYDLENIECFLHRIFSNYIVHDLDVDLNVCDLRVWRVLGGTNETQQLCAEPPCFVKSGDDSMAMGLERKDGNTSMLLVAQDGDTYGQLQALDVEQMSDDFVLAFAISFGVALDVSVSVDNTMVRNQITPVQSDTNANSAATNPETLTTLWIIAIVSGVVLVCIGCVGCMFMLRACTLNDKSPDRLEEAIKDSESASRSRPSHSVALSSPIWQMSNRSQKTHSITSFDVVSNPSTVKFKLGSKPPIFQQIPSRSVEIADDMGPVGPNPMDVLQDTERDAADGNERVDQCCEEEKNMTVNPIETNDMNNHEMCEGFVPVVRVDMPDSVDMDAPSDADCIADGDDDEDDDDDENAFLNVAANTRSRVTSIQMQLMEGTNKRRTANLHIEESESDSESDSNLQAGSMVPSKLSVSLAE